jgi:hypothetical protein
MSPADVKFLLAFVALIFIVMIAATVGYSFDRSEWNEEEHKQESTSEREESAEDDQTDRPASQPSNIREYSDKNHRRGNQNRFQERQLRIAIGLNIITLALAVPAALGLYILIGTLNATRVAADASKQQAVAAEAALRPWISPEDAINIVRPLTLDFSKPNQINLNYAIDVPFKNFGKSPAIEVAPWGLIVWGPYKEIQGKLKELRQYKCGPEFLTDLMQINGAGTFVPPEAEIFYPLPGAQSIFGQTDIKPGTLIQFWLVVLVAYDNPNDIPPTLHHTLMFERFRSEANQDEFPTPQGSVKGKFIQMSGGCAN